MNFIFNNIKKYLYLFMVIKTILIFSFPIMFYLEVNLINLFYKLKNILFIDRYVKVFI